MIDLLCHIFMFVMTDCWLHQQEVRLEFSWTNLWVCRVPHGWQQWALIHSVKIGSFVNILSLMQPSFLFKLLLHQSLTNGLPKNVIKQLQRMQNAAARSATLSPNFCHITLFLRIFTGSRLISGLNLKYLSLTTRLSMDWLLLILKIFFKVLARSRSRADASFSAPP